MKSGNAQCGVGPRCVAEPRALGNHRSSRVAAAVVPASLV